MELSDKAQASLNKVITAFEAGDLSPITKVIRIRRDEKDTCPFAKWSLGNQLMAFIQADGEIDSRGFRQWQEAGRNVKKGATAIFILAPLAFNTETATGEKRTILKGFKTIPVFPVDRTEGDDLPVFDYTPATMPPLYEVAQRLGVSVSYGPTDPSTGGWYSPKKHHIHLGVEAPEVFFHELAHAAHDIIEGVKGGQDVQQETIAEFTAAVLADLYGFDHTGNAFRYISGYAADPLTAIYKAMSVIEKVLALICQDEPLA